jgi:hypothetical protein
MTRRKRLGAALFAAAVATTALVPARAVASEWEGVFGLEAGGGYTVASPRTAAEPSALNGGAFRARLYYGLTDALGVAVTGQIAWFEARRPIVSGSGYGAEITRTRLQDLGGSFIYTLDVLRVVPFLSAGVASMRTVEEDSAAVRVEHDVVLRFEVGADVATLDWFWIGASAVFDTFLTQHADFTAQTTFLIRAAIVLGPGKPRHR